MRSLSTRAGWSLGLAALWVLWATACGHDSSSRPPDAGTDTASDAQSDPDGACPAPCSASSDLPVRYVFDPVRAERGRRTLHEDGLGGRLVPLIGLRNLWLVWGDTLPPPSDEYWERFRERYGLYEVEGEELPLGFRQADETWATVDCLLCHASVTAGETVVGVGNSLLDLEGLYDDLVALEVMARELGQPTFPVPDLPIRTGAGGATDAFGLGMELPARTMPDVGIETDYGYQQAPAWWTIRHRDRIYTDGSGQTRGYRTMMATMFAFNLSLAELQALDDEFEDIHHYILSLEPPAWPFAVDEVAAERGNALFDAECASCHGVHTGPEASFPDLIVDRAEVGTDPIRAERFTNREVAAINASWFGEEYPMAATGGYLAPPLVGVWATAPYFHNGSVPDLSGVIESAERPPRWRRAGRGAADYDPERVGWRYEAPDEGGDPETIEGRRTYDTARPGLSNAGHTYGDDLTPAERLDLLEYLKTL